MEEVSGSTGRLIHAVLRAVALLIMLFIGSPARSVEVDAESVRVSIERGVAYLRNSQLANGTWPESYTVMAPSGVTALCTLALINAGVPLDDPQLTKSIEHLRKLKLDHTYSVSLQTMVLCAAEPTRDLLKIRENVKWLEDNQRKAGEFTGAFSYTPKMKSGDNSNSQFAMLALYEASRVGVSVSRPTWERAHKWWAEEALNVDGAWGYVPNHYSTGSMTCAGIGSMVMINERLREGDARVNGDQVQCCGQGRDDDIIENALRWLGSKFSVHSNPGMHAADHYLFYYLYGVERVGRLTNRRFIGQHDWYREGAEKLLAIQHNPPGSWKGASGENNELVSTSLALLFLSKGRRAVLVAKLKHEPENDWNQHRNDLANLVGYVEQRWRRDLTWQVIDIAKATPDDLLQSPVLTIGGKSAPQFTVAQIEALRKYIDRGGFILAENCCGDIRFEQGIQLLAKQIFPEPEYQLRILEPGHPIWSAEERVDANLMPPLYGVDYGCRTCFVYTPKNLGCYWELAQVGHDLPYSRKVKEEIAAACSVGINILAYATNRELKYKLDSSFATVGNDTRDPVDRGKLAIAKLQHNGGWNVAPGALPNLLQTVAHQTGLRMITDRREVTLTGEQLKNYHLVFMHGRNDFQFTPAERTALKAYLERGGMLVADAVCGSEAFAQAVRREVAAMFPQQKFQTVPAADSLFTNQFGGFELRSVQLRKPETQKPGEPLRAVTREQPPVLEGLELDDRYAVLLSPFDLSCALEKHDSLSCPGYTREDAAKIGLNIILYSLH